MSQTTITPEIAKLFQGKNFASFATLMDDGSPHVAPVWVDLDGNTILINTAAGRVKEKTLDEIIVLPFQFMTKKTLTIWYQYEGK